MKKIICLVILTGSIVHLCTTNAFQGGNTFTGVLPEEKSNAMLTGNETITRWGRPYGLTEDVLKGVEENKNFESNAETKNK